MTYVHPRYMANSIEYEGLSTLPRGRVTQESSTRSGASTQLMSHSARVPRPTDHGDLRRARILIIDDSTLHRESLAAVIATSGTSAPAVAWDLPSLTPLLSELSPDIVLLNMVTREGQQLMRLIRAKHPRTRVIVMGISEEDELGIIGCAEAGVAGYHLRSESLSELLALIAKVLAGETCCSPKVSAILLKRLSTLAARRQPEARELVLTAREIQILRMLEMGLSNRDIADQLCIALHTVKNHVHSVLNKLGVSTRNAAAAYSRSLRYDDVALGDLGTALA